MLTLGRKTFFFFAFFHSKVFTVLIEDKVRFLLHFSRNDTINVVTVYFGIQFHPTWWWTMNLVTRSWRVRNRVDSNTTDCSSRHSKHSFSTFFEMVLMFGIFLIYFFNHVFIFSIIYLWLRVLYFLFFHQFFFIVILIIFFILLTWIKSLARKVVDFI